MHTQAYSYASRNMLATPTQPLTNGAHLLNQLARLSQRKRWILFTAQCPRPDYQQFSGFNIPCQQVLHMKPSQNLSEMEIVIKAIRSDNASAVVASSSIAPIHQELLQTLAKKHDCEVFFMPAYSALH